MTMGRRAFGWGEGLNENAEDGTTQHEEDRREAQPVNLGGLEVSHG